MYKRVVPIMTMLSLGLAPSGAFAQSDGGIDAAGGGDGGLLVESDGGQETVAPTPPLGATVEPWTGVERIDLGVVRSGGGTCRSTDAPQSTNWMYNPEPQGLPTDVWIDNRPDDPLRAHPERPHPYYYGPVFDTAWIVCLWADLWARPTPPRTVELQLRQWDPSRGDDLWHTVSITFAVERRVGLAQLATVLWFPLLLLFIGILRRRRQPGFVKDAAIAWRLDVSAGYRDHADPEWRFTPLSSLSGARRVIWRRVAVALDVELTDDPRVPAISLEPTPKDDEVAVHSSAPLMVKRYGEVQARLQDHDDMIAYGSVVRAGPLVFAPLYAEQVESIHEGRMSLDAPGGELEGRASMVEQVRRRTRPQWLGALGWLGFFGAVATTGLAYALFGPVTSGIDVTLYATLWMGAIAAIGLIAHSRLRRRL